MIELRINGVTLPIPTDLTINREFETTIFNREPDVSDFTLPVDLPLTDEAIRALDFPHVPANPNVKREYDAELIVNGIFINKVTLRVLRTKIKEKKCSVTIIGNYGSFARLAGTLRVNELELGGIRTIGAVNNSPTQIFTATNSSAPGAPFTLRIYWDGCTTPSHIKAINLQTIVDDYVFPTALDEKINLDYVHTSLKDDEDVTSVINAYDPVDGEYIDPIKHYVLSVVNNTFFSSERHFWVPYFRLSFVLRKCFEELGFTVSSSLFGTYFDNILLANTYSINRVGISISNPSSSFKDITLQNQSIYINPRNHVPKMKIIDFVTEVAKNYNLQYIIDFAGKAVTINQFNSLNLSAATVVDMTDIAVPEPEISFERSDFINGYEFDFYPDPEDGASGTDVQDDVADYPYRGAVNTESDLASISSPSVFDVAYVRNVNAYFQYGGSEWFLYSHNLGRHKTSTAEELQQISTKVVPMPLKFISYSFQRDPGGTEVKEDVRNKVIGVYSKMGMEGESMLGIDLQQMAYAFRVDNTDGIVAFETIFRKVKHTLTPTQPHVCIWIGIVEELTSTKVYPMASSVPYTCKGIPILGYAQCWHNPDNKGLYDEHWKDFVARLAASVGVDYEVLLDAVKYANLDLNNSIIRINNVHYLCRKATIPMPFPRLAKLQLVRT